MSRLWRWVSLLTIVVLGAVPGSAAAAPGATAEQGPSSVALQYTGGCGPFTSPDGSTGVVCADGPTPTTGPELAVTAPGEITVRLQGPASALIARVGDPGDSERPLGVTATGDPAVWVVGLDGAIRDGQLLFISTQDNPGDRNYVAKLRLPPASSPSVATTSVEGQARVISARLRSKGRRIGVEVACPRESTTACAGAVRLTMRHPVRPRRAATKITGLPIAAGRLPALAPGARTTLELTVSSRARFHLRSHRLTAAVGQVKNEVAGTIVPTLQPITVR